MAFIRTCTDWSCSKLAILSITVISSSLQTLGSPSIASCRICPSVSRKLPSTARTTSSSPLPSLSFHRLSSTSSSRLPKKSTPHGTGFRPTCPRLRTALCLFSAFGFEVCWMCWETFALLRSHSRLTLRRRRSNLLRIRDFGFSLPELSSGPSSPASFSRRFASSNFSRAHTKCFSPHGSPRRAASCTSSSASARHSLHSLSFTVFNFRLPRRSRSTSVLASLSLAPACL
mmetsp:Transcript_16804/g.38301  ORF Transcript_16804/g.38301 Transcript_16804/m.38301 type:complete len:230 (-) Transcript_16804:47-736(-)